MKTSLLIWGELFRVVIVILVSSSRLLGLDFFNRRGVIELVRLKRLEKFGEGDAAGVIRIEFSEERQFLVLVQVPAELLAQVAKLVSRDVPVVVLVNVTEGVSTAE